MFYLERMLNFVKFLFVVSISIWLLAQRVEVVRITWAFHVRTRGLHTELTSWWMACVHAWYTHGCLFLELPPKISWPPSLHATLQQTARSTGPPPEASLSTLLTAWCCCSACEPGQTLGSAECRVSGTVHSWVLLCGIGESTLSFGLVLMAGILQSLCLVEVMSVLTCGHTLAPTQLVAAITWHTRVSQLGYFTLPSLRLHSSHLWKQINAQQLWIGAV